MYYNINWYSIFYEIVIKVIKVWFYNNFRLNFEVSLNFFLYVFLYFLIIFDEYWMKYTGFHC